MSSGVTHVAPAREELCSIPSPQLTQPASEVASPATEAPEIAEPVIEQVETPVAETHGRVVAAVPQGKNLTKVQREEALAEVAKCVADCTRCSELAQKRTQTVFGVGNPQARVMFIGEAPGADEDEQGEPFVGKAGQLLNKIIEACGWKREDIYICNILRCRPPGNRTPEKSEADNCREFLDAQIRIVNPEYIVCWGSCAAKNLLDSVLPIGKMRRRWFKHESARVLCTYHPSYLLRNPAAKKPVWDDMKLLLSEMGEPVP
ncbi:MAG: uracil-DNA glycosylase [Planctomycetaceae bacterium]